MKNILKNLVKTIALCLLFLVAATNAIYANGNEYATFNVSTTQTPTYEDYYNQFYQFYLNFFNLLYSNNANQTAQTNLNTQAITNAVTNQAITNTVTAQTIANTVANNTNNVTTPIRYAEQDDTEFDISYNFKEDEFTGPGIGIVDDVSLVYNDGGPGIIANGFTTTENNKYVDNGPMAVENECSPSDYLKISTMKPGDFTFNGSSRKDKLNK